MPSPSGSAGRPFALGSLECENWRTSARPDPVGNAWQDAPRPPPDEASPGEPARPLAGRRPRGAPLSQLATPANVLVNNPVGEALGTDQFEVSLAACGNYVVTAWNDGIGYDNFPNTTSTQGCGSSTDGGAT